ncbi:MAG: molecular chaperone TorD family protein [Lentisphaerae bacterium]|jgi:putative dimethyl sulfoxide reductase chaperone|nr:molecular chaperone TorD family protein [Lentisphaerota bacterium]MBT4821724.1 molecular chaperone TorD family protein [Lentisphaerota bacterium]MBT5608832.1 molecular chaperone TorD family protein [Lentisphaerota bacterium]MBT7061516.1 molecular chaperone TorD family protein [Lentisphaerota bacterium]MBT7843363.1 molecular chaperone TorD family protein [Lentisphaerota bacterium]
MVITSEYQRATTYQLLSDCFREPGQGLLDKLAGLDGTCDSLQQQLRDSVGSPPDMERLAIDHARLFVGPFTTAAPPYGSVYLEAQARLMGDSTADAAVWYGEDGLENTLSEPPDHVIIELEYMHFVALKAAEALNAGEAEKASYYLGREEQFLADHLGRWIAAFTQRMEEHAETAFYCCLARLTRQFVADAAVFSLCAEEVRDVDSA